MRGLVNPCVSTASCTVSGNHATYLPLTLHDLDFLLSQHTLNGGTRISAVLVTQRNATVSDVK
jgi:hypothetical protein